MILDMPFKTERLELRSLREQDVGPACVAWMTDEETIRYLASHHAPHSLDTIRRHVKNANDSEDALLVGKQVGND